MLAIYKKELRAYFTSMIGYVFIAFFLMIIGIFFYLQNLFSRQPSFEYTLAAITFIFILLIPLVTMRLMAEENRQKTDQLLFTSPLTASSIVIGKFLAVFTVYGSVMVVTCFYPIIMKKYGYVPMAPAYASILGFLILGGTYLAIGLFISSLTESQVVAAVISFFAFLITVMMDTIASIIPVDNKVSFIVCLVGIIVIGLILYLMMRNIIVSAGISLVGEAILITFYVTNKASFDGLVGKMLKWLSLTARYDSFQLGIFDLADIIYYLSIIVLFLFLTIQVIRKKRWS
jgi:ABC-2 type transport system permease protein